MKKRFVLLAVLISLFCGYLTLNARTAQRLISQLDPADSRQASFFVEPERNLLAQVISGQSQTQTQTQAQTQTQTQSQTQTQTQTQTYYIGFPMQVSWQFRTAGPVVAQPQVDEKFVYCVAKPGVFYKLPQTENKQIWKKNIGDVVEEGFLLKGQSLFYGTEKGRLGALHTEKGRELWRQDFPDESFIYAPGFDSKYLFWSGQNGSIIAISQKDGKPTWRFKAPEACNTTPFAFGKTVYVGCNDHVLYALDSTAGFLRWKFYAGKEIQGSPIATGDYVFFGSDDEYFYCLRQDNGSVLWKVRTGGAIRGVPMFYMDEKEKEIKQILFASFDNFLYNLRIKNGTRIWLASTNARVYNRMHFDRALIFLAPFGAAVTGYDPHTGQRAGDFDTKNRIRSSPITARDRLFIGLNNGNLLCATRMPPPPPETDETVGVAPVQAAATQPGAEEEAEPEQTQTETQTQSQTQSQPEGE